MSTIQELMAKAEQGDYTSLYQLGFLYHNGRCSGVSESVEPNRDEAKKWYRRANAVNEASPGEKYPHGYWHLAYIIKGEEGSRSPEAIAAFKKASELGEPFAMIEIGKLYYSGIAEGLSQEEAKRLIEKGVSLLEVGECKIADLNYLHPQHGLQLCFMFLENGEYSEARKYLNKTYANLHEDEAFANKNRVKEAIEFAEETLIEHMRQVIT